ncbi:protein of unknown function [Maridesulfovibrio hydrothermalis AM13 = DSM 14728]|uniref:Uncharacterized protein n=1 Tax=Maridesulfovibrio hydrothermalis AM13 = DSM 14728 TaxID=1121451 RepID=L0R9Z7_9BACT|nr:protein of unknown function [Maridesulfovibrio hydrothermalis AM13 = DSM 14728]
MSVSTRATPSGLARTFKFSFKVARSMSGGSTSSGKSRSLILFCFSSTSHGLSRNWLTKATFAVTLPAPRLSRNPSSAGIMVTRVIKLWSIEAILSNSTKKVKSRVTRSENVTSHAPPGSGGFLNLARPIINHH